MKNVMLIIQLVVSVALMTMILLQAKGTGLGRAWGGGGEFYKSRRGIEKVLFRFTVFLAAAFLLSSVLNLLSS